MCVSTVFEMGLGPHPQRRAAQMTRDIFALHQNDLAGWQCLPCKEKSAIIPLHTVGQKRKQDRVGLECVSLWFSGETADTAFTSATRSIRTSGPLRILISRKPGHCIGFPIRVISQRVTRDARSPGGRLRTSSVRTTRLSGNISMITSEVFPWDPLGSASTWPAAGHHE